MKRVLARAMLAVVVLVAIASGVGMCARVGARGRYATPYSTYGSGGEGTRGLYLLGEAIGVSTRRWTEDFARLPEGAMLLAFGGCDLAIRRPLRRYESEALVPWVDRGGVLVVAGVVDYLPEDFGAKLVRPAGQCRDFFADLFGLGARDDAREREGDEEENASEAPVEDFPPDLELGDPTYRFDPSSDVEGEAFDGESVDGESLDGEASFGGEGFDGEAFDAVAVEEDDEPKAPPRWARPASGVLSGLPLVPMEQPARIRLGQGVEAETLLTIGGEPAGVVLRRGRGAVIVLSSATPFQNEWLEAGLGGVLLFRLREAYAPGAPLLFDEYHLGVGASRSIVQYLRSIGAGPALLQLLLVVGLLLYRLGARLGVPRAEPAAGPSGSDTYVEAIGALYARTKDRAGVVEILRRRALERIARHFRVDAREPEAILASASERLPAASREAILALAATGGPVKSDRAMVERARTIDAMEKIAIAEGSTKG